MLVLSLSVLALLAALFFLTVYIQPAEDDRTRQMNLFLTLLFQVLSSWLLCDPPVVSWLSFPGNFWAVLAVEFVLGLIWMKVAQSIHFSASSLDNLNRPLMKLFFWIPQQEIENDDELTRLLEASRQPEMVEQREVLENALDLNETSLDEICTHRSDMISLSMKDDPAKWKKIILGNRHTFYPITNESDDDIIGILDTRDYFRLNGTGKKTILDQAVDKPLFAAENMTADELLRLMKQRRVYIAIVLDEYGGVVGLVTLHDIIEELFGELSEQEERRQADIVRLSKNVWRISGEADLEDVSKALGEELHLDDFETFSGYILGSLGYIPDDGAQLEVTLGDLNIQIRRVQGHRIRQTLVRRNEPEEQPEDHPDSAENSAALRKSSTQDKR